MNWLFNAIAAALVSKPKPGTPDVSRSDPNRYPVFPGSTPEESETDDNLDEIEDIEDDL